jgi:hypothetical protein
VNITPTRRPPHPRLHCSAVAPASKPNPIGKKDLKMLVRCLKGLRKTYEDLSITVEGTQSHQETIWCALQAVQSVQPSSKQQQEALSKLRDLPAAAQQDLQKGLRHTRNVTDALLEHALRLSMAAELGADYTRTVHARTITDLVGQLLLHTPQPGGHSVEEVASAAARRLLAEQVPQRLAAHLHHKYKVGNPVSRHRLLPMPACGYCGAALLCGACLTQSVVPHAGMPSLCDSMSSVITQSCLPCLVVGVQATDVTPISTCAAA